MEERQRASVPALDNLLGEPFRVLDDGFVRAIDYMGDDSAIVQAARVSYGAGTKRVQDDRGLIRYLMRHSHSTPFEMCELKLHVRVPMDTWRQWIRHRTANVNEYSTRYSVAIDAFQKTLPSEWRLQSEANRQGSGGGLSLDVGERLSREEAEIQQHAREIYLHRLNAGVAREQARKDLLLSTYTEAYWKIDLHNLFHFLQLRMNPAAQGEIREYARVIGERIVSAWTPLAWEAFSEYKLDGVRFSKLEFGVLSAIARGDMVCAILVAENGGLLKRASSGGLAPNRERSELEAKIASMGISPPWK